MTILLAAILFFTPAYLVRFHIQNYPTTLLEVLIGIFLLLRAIHFKFSDFKKVKDLGQINWAIALFVLAALVSTYLSPDKTRALGQLKAFIIEPILVFYAVVLTVKSERLTVILRALFWSATLISLFGLFQHYTYLLLPMRFWGNGSEMLRIVSVFEYPNALSLYLAPLLGMFVCLWLYDFPLTKNKSVSAIAILTMGVALLLTFSRGAWIAATVGLIVILIKRFGFKKVGLPIMLTGLLLLTLPQVRSRLAIGLSDPSSSAHWELIKVGAHKIVASPIFGNGLAGFRNTQVEANYQGEILNYPHNILINFWLEIGLLGLISFIWIIVLAFRQHHKKKTALTFTAAIYLIILLTHGLVDVPYFKNDLSLLFWFVLALFYL
ncbi:MAG: O-antigen ligase family protein [Candidatus Doudnabacteria bacterium]|nr:O-antigen ligase family protein [Candidatus Doudnabacteria bacterium]